MVRSDSIRMHELTFCAQVKSWCDDLFRQHPEWPFDRAEIEERGRGNNKRADLRIYDRDHQGPILSGEAKMPGPTAATVKALAAQFARAGTDGLENRDVFQTPEVVQAGGLAALKSLGKPHEVLMETKKRMFAA